MLFRIRCVGSWTQVWSMLALTCRKPGHLGSYTNSYYDDLTAYVPETTTWIRLSGTSPPAARASHGFASTGGLLYVHGGTNGSGARASCGSARRRLLAAVCRPGQSVPSGDAGDKLSPLCHD